MGANVVVVEVDPIRALEAAMDGYRVMTATESARVGDLFISGTGNLNVWGARSLRASCRDGAILANAGHFNDEFELGALEEQSDLVARGSAHSPASTSWPTGGVSTCSPMGASSTSARPRATRRWSWT